LSVCVCVCLCVFGGGNSSPYKPARTIGTPRVCVCACVHNITQAHTHTHIIHRELFTQTRKDDRHSTCV
jgi:hypothetical protein